MKIWFLTGEFAPDFGGGIGTYVENCAKMFAEAGDDVTVIVRSLRENIEEEAKEGYRVVRFKQSEENEYYNYLGYDNALAYQYYETIMNLIDKYGKPDIIEMQEYNAYGQYIIQNKLMLNEKLKDVPLVVHLHTPSFETLKVNQFNTYEAPFYWIGEMEKFCIKGADALLCPSQFLADKLQYLVPDKKINVINLPFDIDKDELKKYKEMNPIKDNKKTVLYFGRTEYRKGVIQMLEGAEKLWKKGMDFKIKIIGGDVKLESRGTFIGEALKRKYSQYIQSGNLEMLNPIPHLELIPHILSSTVVTIPSLYENFPNTCIYAMWLGKPVLVSKSGGQAEMVQKSGENGLIFDWDKEGDFEKKLEEILNMSDKDLTTMGNNAQNRIYKLCNMEDNLKRRKEFFKEVIKNKQEKTKFPFVEEMPIDKYINVYEGEKDLLSIVIPYYNLGSTLPETIESIKQSDYTNYEIIIVNDGSSDEESIRVLDKYKDDKKIKIINIDNKGLANARNVGAKAAKGEFIAFLDADDKIHKTFYTKAINILHQYSNVSYVYSWVQYFEGNADVWPTFNVHIPYLLCANMLAAFVVIRKNDFLNFGQNRIEMEYGMEDYDSWVSLAEHGYLGVAIPEKLNFYRVRKDSMSRKKKKKMRIYLYETSIKGHEKLIQKYSKDVYMLLLTNGQPYYWNNPTTPVCMPTTIEQSPDERLLKIERLLNTFPGRVARKMYRGLRKIKHTIVKQKVKN